VKILYYCQHVLGLGHFHRSLEICRACSDDHQLTMVIGGPEIAVGDEPFSIFKLPGLRMDNQFSGLVSCIPWLSVDQAKESRRGQLLQLFDQTAPDCLVLELYPFGRKAFRFELTPLLKAARETPCRVVCSLRDILVEKKQDRLMHEQRAVKALNTYFDCLLVHADPQVVTLETTFELIDEIDVPLHYTGFITPQPTPGCRARMRSSLGLTEDKKLIVASIGSGSVGTHLLKATAEAAQILAGSTELHLRLFTGPYGDASLFEEISAGNTILVVERFSNQFIDWLAAADLSVSMAGYNTSMNVLAAGTPALMLPFDQNLEQGLRVRKLTIDHPIRMLQEEDLTPRQLAGIMARQLEKQRYRTTVDLDGARRTRNILEELCRI
jgi:predicted glycosyltransferase